jgi:hypothetical protein
MWIYFPPLPIIESEKRKGITLRRRAEARENLLLRASVSPEADRPYP